MKPFVGICAFFEKLQDSGDNGGGRWQESRISMDMHNFRAKDIELFLTYCPYCLAYYQESLASRHLAVR